MKKLFKKIHWWVIGYFCSALFYFISVYLIHKEAEVVEKTIASTTMEGLGFSYAWLFFSLISIFIFIFFLGISLLLHRRGIEQFSHKEFSLAVILTLIVIIAINPFRYLFPIVYYNNMESCLEIANSVTKSSCILKNCKDPKYGFYGSGPTECLFDMALKVKDPFLCEKIDINFGEVGCKCLYKLNKEGVESLAGRLAADTDGCGNQYVGNIMRTCKAIRLNDISVCKEEITN